MKRTNKPLSNRDKAGNPGRDLVTDFDRLRNSMAVRFEPFRPPTFRQMADVETETGLDLRDWHDVLIAGYRLEWHQGVNP